MANPTFTKYRKSPKYPHNRSEGTHPKRSKKRVERLFRYVMGEGSAEVKPYRCPCCGKPQCGLD